MARNIRTVPTISSGVQSLFAGWAILGATLHLCLPAIQQATTPIGHPALWLWLLPAAAWALIQLGAAREDVIVTTSHATIPARPRNRAAVIRGSRRLRRPMAAPPVRRAG